MLAAVGQICSKSDVAFNLALCTSVIRRAAASGAKLIYLPEASDFIAEAKDVKSLSRPLNDSLFVNGIKEAARKHNVFVGVGVHESSPTDDRCFNTNLVVDGSGSIVAAYKKLHLFDVDIAGGATILESRTTIPGPSLPEIVPSPVGKLGLLTCYDLRFPEVSLALRKRGADIITYPSAFTLKTGAAHWDVLLRARAIESQCYVFAPAQVGSHSATRHSYGHAMIVDPWGTVVAQAADKAPSARDTSPDSGTFVLADIDPEWIKQLRTEMPLWQQRRHDIYPEL